MKKNRAYTIFEKASSIFLVATLLWLTVSTSFVSAFQEELAKQNKMVSAQSSVPGNSDDTSGTTDNLEEKVPCSNNLSEEFLHEFGGNHLYFATVSSYDKIENAGDYIAFHGELLVPPPNSAA
mgnify:CR=1 FL=1